VRGLFGVSINLNNRVGKCRRGLLWQIVPDTSANNPVRILSRKLNQEISRWQIRVTNFDSCRAENIIPIAHQKGSLEKSAMNYEEKILIDMELTFV
jgi:hypothetical protein